MYFRFHGRQLTFGRSGLYGNVWLAALRYWAQSDVIMIGCLVKQAKCHQTDRQTDMPLSPHHSHIALDGVSSPSNWGSWTLI